MIKISMDVCEPVSLQGRPQRGAYQTIVSERTWRWHFTVNISYVATVNWVWIHIIISGLLDIWVAISLKANMDLLCHTEVS